MHHVSLKRKHWIEKAEAVEHIHTPKNAMHIQNREGHLKELFELQSIEPRLFLIRAGHCRLNIVDRVERVSL